MGAIIVRNMVRADLDHAFAWSVREGWNIGRFDHDTFFNTDPKGFFIAELDGVPVGSISGVSYGGQFGFIGIFILRPEFRGMGYGLTLFNHALDYLNGQNIGLDGVLEQQANYTKSGFIFAHRNIRFHGIGGGEVHPDCNYLTDIPLEQLLEFDRRHFFAERSRFLAQWIRLPNSVGLAVVRNGRICGYGMIRQFIQGWSIAPLFAESEEVAEILFESLAAQHPGEAVYIDIPVPNRNGISLAARHNLIPAFEAARMYTGNDPQLPLQQIYGITTFELG